PPLAEWRAESNRTMSARTTLARTRPARTTLARATLARATRRRRPAGTVPRSRNPARNNKLEETFDGHDPKAVLPRQRRGTGRFDPGRAGLLALRRPCRDAPVQAGANRRDAQHVPVLFGQLRLADV